MQDTFDMQTLTAELTTDEGKRNRVYADTLGLMTIGIGRELTHKGISDAEIQILFNNDVEACCAIMDQEIPWWRNLPANQQRVMINLCFMGWGSFRQFTKFLAAIRAGQLNDAAAELQNSQWWRQVGERGPRVVARLLGEVQT